MSRQTITLCRSSSKVCTICKEPILNKEAIVKVSKKKACHYCCSLEYDVGFVANERDLKEIFMDFYNSHKRKFKVG